MAKITLGGKPTETIGNLPGLQTKAPDFSLTTNELSQKTLQDYSGKKKILNIFPSVDTGICATSARKFNEQANQLENTVVLCISRDLPFAQARFCGAEGLDNIEMLSDFKNGSFGNDYGVMVTDGAFHALHSRAIVVLDENNTVLHTEQVPEIGQEPNYNTALNAIS